VDTEWFQSTLFDASLFSLEPPKWRLLFPRFNKGGIAANHLAKILLSLLDRNAVQGHAFAGVRRKHVRSID
jgi:hypothetical protein